MLYRKIRSYIDDHLSSKEDKILLIEGARQIGVNRSTVCREILLVDSAKSPRR